LGTAAACNESRAGEWVGLQALEDIDEDARVIGFVGARERNKIARSHAQVPTTCDTNLRATHVELGPGTPRHCVVQRNNLVTQQIIAIRNASGNGSRKRLACIDVGLEPRAATIWLQSLLVGLHKLEAGGVTTGCIPWARRHVLHDRPESMRPRCSRITTAPGEADGGASSNFSDLASGGRSTATAVHIRAGRVLDRFEVVDLAHRACDGWTGRERAIVGLAIGNKF